MANRPPVRPTLSAAQAVTALSIQMERAKALRQKANLSQAEYEAWRTTLHNAVRQAFGEPNETLHSIISAGNCLDGLLGNQTSVDACRERHKRLDEIRIYLAEAIEQLKSTADSASEPSLDRPMESAALGTLDPEKIRGLVDQLERSSARTLGTACRRLFTYLSNNASTNDAYLSYEKGRSQWTKWPASHQEDQFFEWNMPDDVEDAKSLAYDIYRSIGESDDQGASLIDAAYMRNRGQDKVSLLQEDFLPYIIQALEDVLAAQPDGAPFAMQPSLHGKKVFIVHGHDEAMKAQVQLLFERAGLDGIVLHEQPDKGRTIIEKLLGESEGAVYAVALFSPDDKQADGTARARQNVVLEVGYFLGKLGRDRVRILVKGDVAIPSDFQGIIYEQLDSSGAWRARLLKELTAVGIKVDVTAVLAKF